MKDNHNLVIFVISIKYQLVEPTDYFNVYRTNDACVILERDHFQTILLLSVLIVRDEYSKI